MKILWLTSDKTDLKDAPGFGPADLFDVDRISDPGLALEALKEFRYDAVLADFPSGDWLPEEWLEYAHRANSLMPVVIRDSGAGPGDAVRLIKLGAYDFFLGGDPRNVGEALEAAVEYRRSRELALFGSVLGQEPWRQFLVGESPAMQNIVQIIQLIANRRCTVLISGETGTGKEMVARAIHMASGRARNPMVPVNCTALPESLLEAELFGHVKGAFTGAIYQRVGRFEQAHRSTLFLDEIGDMPFELQAKLLRFLQEREFQRIGSSEVVRVDVRVIAASNADLLERVSQGKFREDLYYRLNVVPIRVPSLRERFTDIPQLVHHFVDKVCRQEELPPKRVAGETVERLCAYNWPGNVRQLENAVEMAIALSGDRDQLYPSDFPLPADRRLDPAPGAAPVVRVPAEGLDFEDTLTQIEQSILEQALARTGGNKKQAADMLRLKRTTLTAKLRVLKMSNRFRDLEFGDSCTA